MACAMMTDMYQLTMAYAYWKAGTHEQDSVFDLFFRKNPFGGEYTLFAGLTEVIELLETFHFSEQDIAYLQTLLSVEQGFFDWLAGLNCNGITVYALHEGTVCFPRIPMLRVQGPLAICQLLETPLLNTCNFSSLVATNAARMRIAAGRDKILLEFGLRRAQGPNGALSASKFSYLGGFDGTSNVLAGMRFGIPCRGTHAHSFVQSFANITSLSSQDIVDPSGKTVSFVSVVMECCKQLQFENTHKGELAAFIAYAQAFPNSFLALVDTYESLQSGIPNFCSVAWALIKVGYKPVGIRLDSGDLAYLSQRARSTFQRLQSEFGIEGFANLRIYASNDINEETLYSLNQQGHQLDAFGIGTHLVTCQSQPALGAVFKLVELQKAPRIKLSNAATKVSIPGGKLGYRLYGKEGVALIDVMCMDAEEKPQTGIRFECHDPFDPSKLVNVIPHHVECLHHVVWEKGVVPAGVERDEKIALQTARKRVQDQLDLIRIDIKRRVNPTPYKVSVSSNLYDMMHKLWRAEQPVAELS